jgi:hypothetical protein
VFGALAQMGAARRSAFAFAFAGLRRQGSKLVRCAGIVPITFGLQLRAASSNLKRLVFLEEHG